MASPKAFETVIKLSIAKAQPPEVQKLHARIARQGLAEHLARRSDKPRVTTIVDGRRGASENSVRPYGVIRYEFDNLRDAAIFAKEQLEELSPKLTGHYAGRWFFMVDGSEVLADAIPPTARMIIVTNDEPYSRRLVVGKRADGRPFSLQNPPPGFLVLARRAVLARFGNSVEVGMPFILLNEKPAATPRARREQMTYPSLALHAR
ncbi:hypothetical protein [Roseococcus sp. YIM B11640]|uniref:hypothetical protein n=1 Tax=Roseococcus sp. YIM B11640 TaxID=3133973 RepID=UPI003C7D15EE